jgi:hypothetical protein
MALGWRIHGVARETNQILVNIGQLSILEDQ